MLDLLEQTRQDLGPEMEERRELLDDCLEGLVAKERDLLERYYHDRDGAKQIADSLNISASTVYTRLHRIRQFLFECVNDRLVKESPSDNAGPGRPACDL